MPGWNPDKALPSPDFAIAGAAKCGTTALYSYLASHPGIAMSPRKEPCFWSSDIDLPGRVVDRTVYESLWSDAPPGTLRGEASPTTIQSKVAIPRLLAARPDAWLVAMIRNPVEMVASRHGNMLIGHQDDVADLETAWRLQDRRRRGEALPRRCKYPGLLQYGAFAAIGDQLEQFFELVPAEQRIVIVYDDFHADPRREYLRVLALLGLTDDGREDFARHNQSPALRWAGAADFHEWLSKRWLYRPARALAHAMRLHPTAVLNRTNLHVKPRKPLRPAFERELIAFFLPQVEKVERLLDRDLTAWKTAKG
jgi:hypothetical protein